MSPRPTPHDVVFFTDPVALRAWFDANHESADDLWLGYHRKTTGRPSVTWSQAVDEALCFGWIDSVIYSLDDGRSAQRFTPRRKGSIWSAVNVAKVASLTSEGRMRAAGLAAFEARMADRTGIYAYEQPDAALTEEETARLRAVPSAWSDWERRSPSYRKTVLHWVTSAKQPATRARRLAALIADSAAGRRVGPMRSARES